MLSCVWEVLTITAAEMEMGEVFLMDFSSKEDQNYMEIVLVIH